MTKRDEFVRATDSNDWRTLEEIVEALDSAAYWRDQQSPAMDKQGHVHEMIITLFFGEVATGLYDVSNNRLIVGQHAFATTFRANESGERVRVYKPLKNLTFAEVEEMAEQHAALDGRVRIKDVVLQGGATRSYRHLCEPRAKSV